MIKRSFKTTLFLKTIAKVYIFLVLMCAISNAQVHPIISATIMGTVKDVTGAVVVGSRVMLIRFDDLSVKNATTNGQGVFVFSSVGAGVYVIVAIGSKNADCFGPDIKSLVVHEGETYHSDFTFKINRPLGKCSEDIS